ncbi:SGNH/GDSL hydrolase family protein [Bacteroides sp. GM023]|uniref:SGNH/GDSL hydrolase family protein n=1 Tax=Bacteroides sp. GM023 TaxID=2723058 RepID=UPI00168BC21A|nr:SGNH/GDSL hydrolase family protein [Bacteroides sp. GM023]MBD3592049.1 lipase [Bacteroides sp. GM023]
MKKFFIPVVLLLLCVVSVSAQKQIEASTLNLIGKPFELTPNPYHRVDTLVYKGFNRTENRQVRCPAGMAVLFKTNTRNIHITTKWGYVYSSNSTMPISYKGYDLYIKNADGQWQYAASGSSKAYKSERIETFALIENMDGTMHECMMYMPMYSEVISCKIGIDDDAVIESLKSDFRHKIVVYGSSFTQGVSTERSGMSYPMQFMRNTGFQIASLATSGRCLMQPYMTDILVEIKADAFIFDTFSNPDAELIKERLMPFIDRLIAAHPATPLIFQRTIYRERRTFDTVLDAKERAKAATVEELFAKILVDPKYKDVYLITPNASDAHETSVDGTHPNSYGYTLWAKSIEASVIEILNKYGIK